MMKNTLRIMMFALLAFGMFACGGSGDQMETKKVTLDDLKKAESSLSDERGVLNVEAVPDVVEQFCEFVKQNPEDSLAPDCLFKAITFEMWVGEYDKVIELTNKLAKDYPKYENVPGALVMLASEVYDAHFHELGQARATYERVIKNYPDSQWAADAMAMIDMLGMSGDEMYNKIRSQEADTTTQE